MSERNDAKIGHFTLMNQATPISGAKLMPFRQRDALDVGKDSID